MLNPSELYQPNTPSNPEREHLWREAAESPVAAGRMSIEDYQYWAAQDWALPHHGHGMNRRLQEKIKEETAEFIEASERDHIVEEAGDLLWLIAAAATKGALPLEGGDRSVEEAAASGFIAEHGGSLQETGWFGDEPLSIQELGDLIVRDTSSIVEYAVAYTADKAATDEMLGAGDGYSEETRALHRMMFILERQIKTQRQLGMVSREFNEQIRHNAAVAFWTVAALAYKRTGAELSEILHRNMQKLSRRREDGTLFDKSLR